jgi:hypothetical protein
VGHAQRFFLCRNDQQSGNNENTTYAVSKMGRIKTNKMAEKAETKYLKLSGLEP